MNIIKGEILRLVCHVVLQINSVCSEEEEKKSHEGKFMPRKIYFLVKKKKKMYSAVFMIY